MESASPLAPSGIGESVPEPKVVWRTDFAKTFGVSPRNANDVGDPLCIPLIIDDLVFSVTNHGKSLDNKGVNAAAPSFVAVKKATGEVVWTSTVFPRIVRPRSLHSKR
ncbi:MAG: hypothetical protein JWL59_5180 [Chthoniobacteraceae bacterium]|nr:hypothetical protein [Chthoniobacteraceae bacterium]